MRAPDLLLHALPDEPAAPATLEAAFETMARLAGVEGRPPHHAAGSDEADAARLRHMEARYRALVEQIPAVSFMAALDGALHEIYVSPQIEALLGYTQQEWLADPVLWFRRLHPDDRDMWTREFSRGCREGGSFRADCRFVARDGAVVWVHGEARVETDREGRPLFLQGVAYDITERKRAEETMAASLREKETLLKEIHHRVKNNLQITSSLLNLQASRIRDEASRRALQEGQARIRAIALVHEMLYRSSELSRIDFAPYARKLVEQIAKSASPRPGAIAVRIAVDDVWLGIDAAVPCGLLVSELVSNCYKHAFPGERAGQIRVGFHRADPGWVIEVCDDGVGLPPGVDPATSGSLGLELVRTLTRQLRGRLQAASSPEGTEMRVALPAGVAEADGRGAPRDGEAAPVAREHTGP